MTKKEKSELIERYRHGVEAVEASILGIDEEAYDFVPPIEDAWTIRAQIAHMLDADFFGRVRIRTAVAQSDAAVDVWDQDAWAGRLDYASAKVSRTLCLQRLVREALADFLESLVDRDWGALAIDHPEHGRIDLAEVVAVYADHIGFHIKLIERNLKAYRER